MDFRYLEAFLVLAEELNFTRAATRLRIAQSAVSRQIRLFEESVGRPLFRRTSRQVALTPEGEELRTKARELWDWKRGGLGRPRARLRIGTLSGALDTWLLERLAAIPSEKLPDLVITTGSSLEILAKLQKGELDLGIVSDRNRSGALVFEKIFRERFCLISRRPVDLKNIAQLRWIHSGAASYLTRLAPRTSGGEIRAPSVPAIVRLVEAGLGVAIVATHLVPARAKVERRDLPNVSKGDIYLGRPRRSASAEATELARALLKASH